MKKGITVAAGLFLGMSGAVIASLSIPNVFSSGQTASASMVNANFSFLASAIDSLATRVAATEMRFAVQDVNGTLFGANVSGFDTASVSLAFGANVTRITCSATNCAPSISAQLLYTSADCSGTPLVAPPSGPSGASTTSQLAKDAAGAWYLAQPGATPFAAAINSFYSGSCGTTSGTMQVINAIALTSSQSQFLDGLSAPFKVVRTNSASVVVDVQ